MGKSYPDAVARDRKVVNASEVALNTLQLNSWVASAAAMLFGRLRSTTSEKFNLRTNPMLPPMNRSTRAFANIARLSHLLDAKLEALRAVSQQMIINAGAANQKSRSAENG